MKDALLCRHLIILYYVELPIFELQKPSSGSLYCLLCPYMWLGLMEWTGHGNSWIRCADAVYESSKATQTFMKSLCESEKRADCSAPKTAWLPSCFHPPSTQISAPSVPFHIAPSSLMSVPFFSSQSQLPTCCHYPLLPMFTYRPFKVSKEQRKYFTVKSLLQVPITIICHVILCTTGKNIVLKPY